MKVSAGIPAVRISRDPLQGRRLTRRLMTLSGTTAFLLLIVACSGSESPPAPAADSLKTHKVVYQAEGAGTAAASYTWTTDDGGTSQGNIDLPLKSQAGDNGIELYRFKTGASLYLSIQNTTDAGAVTCRILVDGTKVSEVTSSGGYKIATCTGRVS